MQMKPKPIYAPWSEGPPDEVSTQTPEELAEIAVRLMKKRPLPNTPSPDKPQK
jgi:hypothetical protein